MMIPSINLEHDNNFLIGTSHCNIPGKCHIHNKPASTASSSLAQNVNHRVAASPTIAYFLKRPCTLYNVVLFGHWGLFLALRLAALWKECLES
jgi:hypothetical protein